MSSMTEDDRHLNPMKWARHRTVRFIAYGLFAFGALFGVLAVKAQILPAPSWTHPFLAWDARH